MYSPLLGDSPRKVRMFTRNTLYGLCESLLEYRRVVSAVDRHSRKSACCEFRSKGYIDSLSHVNSTKHADADVDVDADDNGLCFGMNTSSCGMNCTVNRADMERVRRGLLYYRHQA